jgi:UDP-N-acetylmuramoyl-tripeptide--D-alanyl-D-alanine ligase
MSMTTLPKIAAVLGLELDSTAVVNGICTDSRQLKAGDLFLALKGENFDGHEFVTQALAQGAVAAIVEKSWALQHPDGMLLCVDSTTDALNTLAAWWRREVAPKLVAITGSNGKTTVKDMTTAILRAQAEIEGLNPEAAVLATHQNLNNTLGVPFTLLRLRPGHRWAVVEMGMNHEGEIAQVSPLAAPDVALVNNIQRAHIGFLGGLAAVARAKAEIFIGLGPEGIAILPADCAEQSILVEGAGGHSVRTFGLMESAWMKGTLRGDWLDMVWPGGECSVRLTVLGEHNRHNALAAASAAVSLGASAAAVQNGLTHFRATKGRLEVKFTAQGTMVIDDTYNANPDSVLAAIDVLSRRSGLKVLVLGDLGELGSDAPAWHHELGLRAREARLDACYTLGELTRETQAAFGEPEHHFTEAQALANSLKPHLNAEATVLVKGSRFMGMEQVVNALLKD